MSSASGHGIRMSNANVELMDVALKGCNNSAFHIPSSTFATTVVATRCEFANSGSGARVEGSLTSATLKNCLFHIKFKIEQKCT